MAKHLFAKAAKKGIATAYEKMVFALNVPMLRADREELRSLLEKAASIIDKY